MVKKALIMSESDDIAKPAKVAPRSCRKSRVVAIDTAGPVTKPPKFRPVATIASRIKIGLIVGGPHLSYDKT